MLKKSSWFLSILCITIPPSCSQPIEKKPSLPKSNFVNEVFDPSTGPYSYSRKKQTIPIDFANTNNFIEPETTLQLEDAKVLEIFIIKSRNYTHDNSIFNNFYKHLVVVAFEDRVEIRTRNLKPLLVLDKLGVLIFESTKPKMKLPVSQEDKDKFILKHIQCEQFLKNTVNCVGVFDPKDIIVHFKFTIKVNPLKDADSNMQKNIKILHKVWTLAPLERLISGGLLINGTKNTRKWDQADFAFDLKSIQLFQGQPKDEQNLVVVLRSHTDFFL